MSPAQLANRPTIRVDLVVIEIAASMLEAAEADVDFADGRTAPLS